MTYYKSKQFTIPFTFGILALIAITTSKIVELTSGEKIHQIAWLASAFIMISTLIIKYYSLDLDKFDKIIQDTNPIKDKPLSSSRYPKFLSIAMIIGLAATITIHYNFIFGMLVYLLMQVSLIIAFSGIFHINPKIAIKTPELSKIAIISMIFWTGLIAFVYLVFVYSGSESLIVVPYVVTIGIMAHYTWHGLSYSGRSKLFQFMLILGSFIFVFSDALIGNDVYGEEKVNENLFHLIDITYVLNIFLLSQAVLFLKTED
jgi:hypothetical protein